MRSGPYTGAHHCLLDQARAAGCVLPAFTPDDKRWPAWDLAVSKAHVLRRAGTAEALAAARGAADALAGHPVSVPMFAVPPDAFAMTAAAFAEAC